MTVNPKGEVMDHQIAETVIRVDRRMSYTQSGKDSCKGCTRRLRQRYRGVGSDDSERMKELSDIMQGKACKERFDRL